MPSFRLLILALFLCAPVLCAPASANPLIPSPPLAPDVAALPRLEGDTETAQYINEALADLDRRHLALVTCNGATSDQPYRAVETLSPGPRFLTFLISLGGFCDGAAHTLAQRELVTFDLASGLRSDLLDLLPPAWSTPREAGSGLFALYRANVVMPMTDDCLKAFTDTLDDGFLSFDLGPALRTKELVLLPVGLPHVDIACEGEARVPLDKLRAAGFDQRLLRAFDDSP